jgi:ribosomal subunit interface protein
MQIALTGKNFDVPEDTRAYVDSKLSKLMRLHNRIERITVTLTDKASKTKAKACRVEVVLHIPGSDLHSDESAENHRMATDLCVEKLAQQLAKAKGRLVDKQHQKTKAVGRANGKTAAAPAQPAAQKSAGRRAASGNNPLVYVEKFSLKPMATGDAILQLNGAKGSKRGFYLFFNASGNINCVYKREDGHYGLVVPETEIEE